MAMPERPNDRGGKTGRPAWRAALALLATLLAGSPVLPAELLDQLDGRWTTDGPPPFTMSWDREGEGFALRWTVPGGKEASVHFAPTGRPGVFAGQEAGGWSMFGGKEPVNPLVGGTLYWARSTPDAVYVYSLTIDDRGGFVLDRYACRGAGEGRLDVVLQRRLPQGEAEETAMQLAKAGS
jgi:hypothetical protein